MLPPFRPAVFACPMRHVHGEKPKKVWPPPYPAWPEITDPSTFYTLPTVASHPAIECECWPREISLDPIDNFTNRELFCLMFPDEAEAILAKYPVMTDDDFA